MRAIFIIAIWFGLAYALTEFVADRVETSHGHAAPMDATQSPSIDAAQAGSVG
jgi:hypothetical protein